MANKGDKFIVEIEEVINTDNGPMYRMKNFNTLTFDENGIEKLDPLPKCESTKENDKGLTEQDVVRLIRFDMKLKAGDTIYIHDNAPDDDLENTLYGKVVKAFTLLSDVLYICDSVLREDEINNARCWADLYDYRAKTDFSDTSLSLILYDALKNDHVILVNSVSASDDGMLYFTQNEYFMGENGGMVSITSPELEA